tara:strand:+ start:86 stop:244 length:159 start_codon:yes stop_codon:yes gene_type:complete
MVKTFKEKTILNEYYYAETFKEKEKQKERKERIARENENIKRVDAQVKGVKW